MSIKAIQVLDFKKDQINKILDLDSRQSSSQHQEVVYVLNGIGQTSNSYETKKDMAKEEYFELTKVNVRSRKKQDADCQNYQQEIEKPLYSEKDIIYVDLKDDDSLQKFALTFNCSVAEIKLANKIYTDQDLFALKTIKIPVVKGGTLYQRYQEENSRKDEEAPSRDELIRKFNENIENKYKFRVQSNSSNINPELSYMSESEDEVMFDTTKEITPLLNDADVCSVRLGQPFNQNNSTFNDFIENMDRKIESEVARVEARRNNLDDVVDSLNTKVIFPLARKTQPEKYGSICTFTWTHFLCLFCIVAILVPTVGYIYYYHYRTR